jgi:hypothetical protein
VPAEKGFHALLPDFQRLIGVELRYRSIAILTDILTLPGPTLSRDLHDAYSRHMTLCKMQPEGMVALEDSFLERHIHTGRFQYGHSRLFLVKLIEARHS